MFQLFLLNHRIVTKILDLSFTSIRIHSPARIQIMAEEHASSLNAFLCSLERLELKDLTASIVYRWQKDIQRLIGD